MADNVSRRDLARFSPLASLGPDNLKELSAKARYMSLAAGRHLFRDGQRGDARLFLVKGTVELHGASGIEQTVEGDSEAARNALDVIGPGARAARARTDVVALAVDRDLLDLMLTWDQTGSYRVEELADAGEEDDGDWMTRLLQTESFRRIPPAHIQAIFMRMEPVTCKAGDIVIRQDEPGDYFYIIRDGRCLVTRATKAKPDGIRLAELGTGDSFGEEALIADRARNATVTMLSSGTLMRLSREDFNALLTEPLIERVDFESAAARIEERAGWIDVRLPDEFGNGHIESATNVPLFVLRMKAQRLDPARTWILYCDTGRRSSAAAFILSERGFDVRVLKKGLAGVPADAITTGGSV